IPKLIAWDDATGRELFTWGPRPAGAQHLLAELLALPEEERDMERMKERLHRWYFDDGGASVQRELLALVRGAD
ncbi:MAG: thioredoxin family protein, partial [Flavobacteriales bacterium]|nr:thioredoxin family protein [Flavobacteriales bacterium]